MSLSSKFVSSITEIPADTWRILVNTDYPFVQYDFLLALETSNSVGEGTGWQPHYYLVNEGERPVAALPLFAKTHSMGEYVFDWAWAEAHQRYGFEYYPKLTACIPFTPVTGSRIFSAGPLDQASLSWILQDLMQHCDSQGLSSIHVLFNTPQESRRLTELGWQQRQSVQFQWHNRHYDSFEDFLSHFSSRKRKNVKKERASVAAQGITVKRLTGTAISAQDMRFFYHCYQQTYLKRSGHGGYLSLPFFSHLQSTMAHQLVLVIAYHRDQAIAAALYFTDAKHLYGRYWGAIAAVKDLHFECCYYQGIEYAIEQGLQVFNPGTQGEHKIQRGFEPITCYSNHWLAIPEFRPAIAAFLTQETEHLLAYRRQAASLLPFKDDVVTYEQYLAETAQTPQT